MPERTHHTKERCGNDWLTNASATSAQCWAADYQIEAPPDQDTKHDARPFTKPLTNTDNTISAHPGHTSSRRPLNPTQGPDVRSNCRPLKRTLRNAKQATPTCSPCGPSDTTGSRAWNNTGSRPLKAKQGHEPLREHNTTCHDFPNHPQHLDHEANSKLYVRLTTTQHTVGLHYTNLGINPCGRMSNRHGPTQQRQTQTPTSTASA
jgi:hypothetical protein